MSIVKYLVVLTGLIASGCLYPPVDENERQEIWKARDGLTTYIITCGEYGGGCASMWQYTLDVRRENEGLVFRRKLWDEDGPIDKHISARLDEEERAVWVRFGNGPEEKIEIPKRLTVDWSSIESNR